MYLHLGQNVMIHNQDVIGVFDLDNTSWSFRTRRFLERAEREGRVVTVGDDLPRSFVLSQEGDGPSLIHITQLTTATLLARSAEKRSVRELGPERGRAMGPQAPETSPSRRKSDRTP